MPIDPWVNVFGGQPAWPSNVSYLSYDLDTIGSSITLEFPWVATTLYVTAGTMQISTSDSARTVTMPDVTIVSPGTIFWIWNSGSADLDILKNDGSALVTLEPTQIWSIEVIDNTTAAGDWLTSQFASSSSTVIPAQLAGPGLIVDPLDSLKLATAIESRTFNDAGYTVQASDRAMLLVWTGGTDTLYLPDYATAGFTNFIFYISNMSVGGILTIETVVLGQTINLESSIVCNPGISYAIQLTAANGYFTIGTPEVNLTSFSFPDGTIGNPSINFITNTTSGFSHTFTAPGNEAINVSLNGVLQANFVTAAGVSTANFSQHILSEDITLTAGAIYLEDFTNRSRLVLGESSPDQYFETHVYNVAGSSYVATLLSSTGLLNYDTAGNPLRIQISDGTLSTPAFQFFNDGWFYYNNANSFIGITVDEATRTTETMRVYSNYIDSNQSDHTRDQISYAAWVRLMT